METMIKLQKVMQSTFVRRGIVITRDSVALDIDGWDSLSHTILMMEIEAAFCIEIDPDHVYKLATVGELVDYIDALVNPV